MKNKIKNIINNIIKKNSPIQIAILYGSSLKKLKNKTNDIDIAIAGEGKINYQTLAELQIQLEKKLEKKVDLVDINTINGPILQQILCKGELIKCLNQNLYVKIMKRMLFFQEDILPYYKKILRKRAERFANG